MQSLPAVVVAATLGSFLATEWFAWSRAWHPTLGQPLTQWGIWPVYGPWRIWQWACWWGWQYPDAFIESALCFVGILAGLFVLVYRQSTTQEGARWATRRDL